ncbi:MAG TPA: FMN-binding negative transcriptional regulator [Actinomycetes bacterium]|nr:FMN-binding negative transcriptional regulator [Actinomycetes bacterium]
MYIPRHFAAGADDVRALLAGLGAADLVTMTDGGLVASFLPLLHEPEPGPYGRLLGHLARPNDQWSRTPTGEALVIVHGPNGYVSPTWYAAKAVHGRVVPTWNYVTAHVYGRLVVHDDPVWLQSLVRRLTERHERGRDPVWSVDDAPEEHIAGQLRAIVGIEVLISRVEAKLKLSQNRPASDLPGLVAGLRADGQEELAGAVADANASRAAGETSDGTGQP